MPWEWIVESRITMLPPSSARMQLFCGNFISESSIRIELLLPTQIPLVLELVSASVDRMRQFRIVSWLSGLSASHPIRVFLPLRDESFTLAMVMFPLPFPFAAPMHAPLTLETDLSTSP